MAAQRSVLEVLGVVFIITLPTVPVVYFMWRAIVSGHGEKAREVTSGRSAATPFGLLSIVSTLVLIAAVAVTLLVVGVRALVA